MEIFEESPDSWTSRVHTIAYSQSTYKKLLSITSRLCNLQQDEDFCLFCSLPDSLRTWKSAWQVVAVQYIVAGCMLNGFEALSDLIHSSSLAISSTILQHDSVSLGLRALPSLQT